MNLDFFRREYDKAFGAGPSGLDGYFNSDSFYKSQEWMGFFCCVIVWNV